MKVNLWLATPEDVEGFGLIPKYHKPPVFLGQRAVRIRRDGSLFAELGKRYFIEPVKIHGLSEAHDGVSHYRMLATRR